MFQIPVNNFFDKKDSGFTLLETLFAMLIISIGLLVVFAFVQYPLYRAPINQSRLTASYLAQEGIEIVRNIRDTNWISGNDWTQGLSDGDYQASYGDFGLSPFANGKLYELNNFYTHDSSGTPTKFSRKITLTNTVDENNKQIIKVVALVTWQEKGGSYTYSAQENLYGWYTTSSIPCRNGTCTGLLGGYYINESGINPPTLPEDPPVGPQPVFYRLDQRIDFSYWGQGQPISHDISPDPMPSYFPTDNFMVRWKGKLRVTNPGNYDFETILDDGFKFYIDGNLISNPSEWKIFPSRYVYTYNVPLSSGDHDVVLEYFESYGDAGIKLNWKKSSESSYQNIPPSDGTVAGFYHNWPYVTRTVSLSPSADVRISAANDSDSRVYIKFNTGGIPQGALINDARLQLTISGFVRPPDLVIPNLFYQISQNQTWSESDPAQSLWALPATQGVVSCNLSTSLVCLVGDIFSLSYQANETSFSMRMENSSYNSSVPTQSGGATEPIIYVGDGSYWGTVKFYSKEGTTSPILWITYTTEIL